MYVGLYDVYNKSFKNKAEVCGTITANCGCSTGCGCFMKIEKINEWRVRKLTPKECWRLMGFTDEDYGKASTVVSKSQLYKQAGNSIVVPVLEALFRQLNIKGVEKWNKN